MKTTEFLTFFRTLFHKYQYVLFVCFVGLLLLLWPQKKVETDVIAQDEDPSDEVFALEARLEEILEAMEGVGRTKVVLTVRTGKEMVYASDRSESLSQNEGSGTSSRQTELVTVNRGGEQMPVALQQIAPVYQGAVVVCQGADSASVRLFVTQAVQSLTGLTSDRIVISKMKS